MVSAVSVLQAPARRVAVLARFGSSLLLGSDLFPRVHSIPSFIAFLVFLDFHPYSFVSHSASVFVRMRDVVAPTFAYSIETDVPYRNTRSSCPWGRNSGRRSDKFSTRIAAYLGRTTPRWPTTKMCTPALAQTSRPKRNLPVERICASRFGHSPVCSKSIHNKEARKQAGVGNCENGVIRGPLLQVPRGVEDIVGRTYRSGLECILKALPRWH